VAAQEEPAGAGAPDTGRAGAEALKAEQQGGAGEVPAGPRDGPAGPGSVVDYHGSQRHLHGRKVITAVHDDGRCNLIDPDRPLDRGSHLYNVRPVSVTLTGERIELYSRPPHSPQEQDCREPRAREGQALDGPAPEPAYEGHVRYADGSVISLQCHEDRCLECPDEVPDGQESDNGPLDGYNCEHGCGHGPAPQRRQRPGTAPRQDGEGLEL
jgi:hypothetical protein